MHADAGRPEVRCFTAAKDDADPGGHPDLDFLLLPSHDDNCRPHLPQAQVQATRGTSDDC